MRRRFARTWALPIAATIVALIAVGPLHMVLEEHDWCPDHREIVRAHGHDTLDDGHHDRHRGPDGGQPRLPHSHDEDRCAWSLLLSAPGAAAQPVLLSAAPAALHAATLPPALRSVPRPLPVLRYAPSHSPPAFPV